MIVIKRQTRLQEQVIMQIVCLQKRYNTIATYWPLFRIPKMSKDDQADSKKRINSLLTISWVFQQVSDSALLRVLIRLSSTSILCKHELQKCSRR